jgi:pyrroloquinoline-quinone synthase
VHSNCEDLELRQALLENLIEEERGENHHPELWLRFAEGLGVSREAVRAAETRPETRACVSAFLQLTRDPDAAVGLAALYAYESQIPAVSETKIQGLESFYGIKDARSREFFEAHRGADVWHSRVEREAIQRLARTPQRRAAVVAAVRRSCESVLKLLDGVCEAQDICLSC